MTRASKIVVLATASLLGSTLLAAAQTPAGGADAGIGADASRAERIRDSQFNRESGVTTGAAGNRRGYEGREMTTIGPSGAPVPDAAISPPTAVEAAPAGR